MPRLIKGPPGAARPAPPGLVTRLADELRSGRVAGQPRVVEEHFPRTGGVQITVLWDEWQGVDDAARAQAVRAAYDQIEDAGFNDRIMTVIGMTLPEAYASGLLPHEVQALVRASDPVTPDDCAAALVADGASTLFPGGRPVHRFETEAEAQAAVGRLTAALPGSADVWAVRHDPVSS